MDKELRILISGGGTGGHIFPAIAIADAVRKAAPDTEILFVGAEGRMEMEKVPAAGYRIVGLPVAGLQRRLTAANLSVPVKVIRSLHKAGKILNEFKPDVVVGVGGYASAPMLWKAQSRGIPTLIQEQNSYAGLTNRTVGRKALRICVAYEGMDRFFPADRITLTGNPIRGNIRPYTEDERAEGLKHYGLSPSLPTVLIVGGSGGCGTFNTVMTDTCRSNRGAFPFQVIWQSGKGYSGRISGLFSSLDGTENGDGLRILGNVRNCDFITRMDLAFAAADIVVSRAGAGTISELCAIGKATVFVPSPNVAEDHQTHNAMALVRKDAAVMVKDSDAGKNLMSVVEDLLKDRKRMESLEYNIRTLAKPYAADEIAEEIIRIKEKRS